MTTTTSIHVQLGTAFWLLVFALIVGIAMWAKLGSENMSKVLSGGIRDAFQKRSFLKE
jgi:hypothetical protein